MPSPYGHPAPVDYLFADPAYRALPVAGKGMVWQLIEHHHATECRPLPTAPAELQCLARAHPYTWARHRLEILAILARWIPNANRYRAHRLRGRWTLQRAADASHASRQRNRMAQNPSPTPTQTLPTQDLALPRSAPLNTPRQSPEAYRSPTTQAPSLAFAD